MVGGLTTLRSTMLDGTPGFVAFLGWVAWCVVLSLLAVCACELLQGRQAEGSGLPQVKSILSGTQLPHFLGWRSGLAKAIGVVLALAAGLTIGKEGPFVHIAACIAAGLWTTPAFSSLARTGAMRRQLLGSAVAAGVTAVLGAPIGGVLFSIEVTSSFYNVSNLWRSVLCAVVCVFLLEACDALQADELFRSTDFEPSDVSWELLGFTVLSFLCGLAGSAFVWVTSKVQVVRQVLIGPTRSASFRHRAALVAGVAAVVATLTFTSPFLQLTDKQVINSLFRERAAGGADDDAGTASLNTGTLVLFLLVRVATTPVSISMPLPCGLFTPVFAYGAAIGRLFGSVVAALAPHAAVEPGAYAVVGAAALSASATHTVSTAVIVFELTGQLGHMLPVLFGTVVAYSTAQLMTRSVYDVLLTLHNIPSLAHVQTSQFYSLVARDLAHSDEDLSARTLHLGASFADALHVLSQPPLGSGSAAQTMYDIPVVNNPTDMVLLGSVPRAVLVQVFERHGRFQEMLSLASQRLEASVGAGAGASERLRHLPVWTRQAISFQGLGQASSGARAVDHAADQAAAVAAAGSAAEGPSGHSAAWPRPHAGSAAGDVELAPVSRVGALSEPALPADPAPMQVVEWTPVGKVHFLFATCMFSQLFVTRHGRLTGVLLRQDLADSRRTSAERLLAPA